MATMQIVWVALAGALMLIWLALVVTGPRKIDAAIVLVVLRYGAVLRTLALVLALAPPMIMVYAVWGFPWRSSNMMNLAALCFLTTSIIAGLLLIEVTRVQVVMTEDGITRDSPWSQSVTLRWIEIERVRYSSVNRWFIVEGAGKAIRVSRHLANIGAFAAAVRHRVAAERWVGAASVIDAVA